MLVRRSFDTCHRASPVTSLHILLHSLITRALVFDDDRFGAKHRRTILGRTTRVSWNSKSCRSKTSELHDVADSKAQLFLRRSIADKRRENKKKPTTTSTLEVSGGKTSYRSNGQWEISVREQKSISHDGRTRTSVVFLKSAKEFVLVFYSNCSLRKPPRMGL